VTVRYQRLLIVTACPVARVSSKYGINQQPPDAGVI
jgi:hypothetical protein